MLNLENLFVDTPYERSEDMPRIKEVVIHGEGYRLYGYILTPGAQYKGKRPCVIMSHGFPGYTTNNDLEHALRRSGCVVIHVNHRGAWGSEGSYYFSHLVDDITLIYEWALSDQICCEFAIDTEQVFLVGHSMGGMTVLNATRKLTNIRGTVAITPYDLSNCFTTNTQDRFKEMIHEEGICLHMDSEEALFNDALACKDEFALTSAARDLYQRPLLLIGADCDEIAPPQQMIEPLYNEIMVLCKKEQIVPRQKYVVLHTDHSLCASRIQLAKIIAEWINTNL